MTDIKELRRVASDADSVQWLDKRVGRWIGEHEIAMGITDDALIKFIQTFNPSAILSLLDKIDALTDALQMAKHIVDANGTQEQLDQIFEALESAGVKP